MFLIGFVGFTPPLNAEKNKLSSRWKHWHTGEGLLCTACSQSGFVGQWAIKTPAPLFVTGQSSIKRKGVVFLSLELIKRFLRLHLILPELRFCGRVTSCDLLLDKRSALCGGGSFIPEKHNSIIWSFAFCPLDEVGALFCFSLAGENRRKEFMEYGGLKRYS